MAQTNSRGDSKDSRTLNIEQFYSENLAEATTASFVTALDVDSRPIRESVIVIHNRTAGDLDYQILANARPRADIVNPTGTDDDNKGWVVLKSASIASTVAPDKFSLSDTWTQVIVRVKHTSDSTIVVVTHRGEN